MMSLILVLIVAFISFFLGILVLSNNFKNKANIFFFTFSLSSSAWIISNYFSLTTDNEPGTLFWIRAVLFVTTWLGSSLFYLALTYPNSNKTLFNFINVSYLLLTFAVSITSFLPTTVIEVHTINGNVTPQFGITYAFYAILLLFNTLFCLFILVRKFFKFKGLDRIRIQYMLLGFGFMILTSLTLNLVFVVALNITSFVIYGPFSIVILDIVIAFTIIKHRFLSITNFVNNAIEILLNTLLLHILFYGLVYFFTNVFGGIFTLTTYISGFFIGIGCVIIIQIYFKKSSKKRFINKKYDPKVFINILREKEYINQNTHQVLNEFIEICKNSLGVENITILDKENYKLSTYYGLFLFLSHEQQNAKKKIFLAQENVKPFDLLEGSIENLSALIPVYHENKLAYLLVFSNRKNYLAYDVNDIRALEEAADRINLAIARTILTEEQHMFNLILQKKLDAATEELRRQKDSVEDRYRTERDMMGIMGHELRTPLTTARGFLEIIISKAKLDNQVPIEKFQHYLENIYNAFKREIELVQTMLSTSHVDNNKLQMDVVPVNLGEIIETTLIDYRAEAEKKQLILEYHAMENLPLIKCDPSRTLEITNNLVSNAIKYTLKGRIDILVNYDDEYVYFQVKDTGEGIPEHELQNIGKKFYRIQNYVSQNTGVIRPGGTGLGMYIVKAILAACGGELRVTSKVGEGSTFTAVFARVKK